MKSLRNMPCPCGAGKKLKKCCDSAEVHNEKMDELREQRERRLEMIRQERQKKIDAGEDVASVNKLSPKASALIIAGLIGGMR